MHTIDVLDKGYVKLIRSMGLDEAVLDAARICYQAISKGLESDYKLMRRLLTHEHLTPFEHACFTFEVKAPIFVVRQWFRHRIGWSYNERSLRYTKGTREYYVPPILNEEDVEIYNLTMGESFDSYEFLLAQGWKKEQARGVLGTAVYTEFMATCNARSLMYFVKLRADTAAQWEIQQYALALLEFYHQEMPMAAQIFEDTILGG